MVKLSLSFGLSAALTFSFCCSSSLPLPPVRSACRFSLSPYSNPPCPQNLALDLLSVLGSRTDAAAVEKRVASEIWSCLRFLVPYSCDNQGYIRLRRDYTGNSKKFRAAEKDEMIRWPPEAVMDLARLAVDSGGDPAAIQAALDPTVIQVIGRLQA